ncbi:cation transporter, partial [Rhizobium leguminosarum]
LTLPRPHITTIAALYSSPFPQLASTTPSNPAQLLSWRPFPLFSCGVAAPAAGLRPDVIFAIIVLVLTPLNPLNIHHGSSIA